jgi:hypothetical protein
MASRNFVICCFTVLFYAFDILWNEHVRSDDEAETRRFRNGEDVRYLPLTDRKLRLRQVVPNNSERLLFCDHVEEHGEALFYLACERDLVSGHSGE